MAAISVTIAGVVKAAYGYAIELSASGSVNNTGNLTSGLDAVLVTAGVANVQNSGTIVSTADQGVELFGGGTVTNAAGASISGLGDAGIFVIGGLATISNSGGISGLENGILVAAGGTVTNNSTGTISGQTAGVALSHGGTLNNYGSVSATAAAEAGADLELGGNLNNYAGGSISGAGYGAFVTGAPGTIMNAGTITGAALYGIALNDGAPSTMLRRALSSGKARG